MSPPYRQERFGFDESVKRLNADEKDKYLGTFSGSDKLISIYINQAIMGKANFDLSTHFVDDLVVVEKYKRTKANNSYIWIKLQINIS